MYCRSGTGGRCCVCAGKTLRVRSPDGSTFLREKTSWPPSWNYDVISEMRLRQSIPCVFRLVEEKFRQISSRSHIWNDRTSCVFLKRSPQNNNRNNNMSSNVRSALGPKIMICYALSTLETIVAENGDCRRIWRQIVAVSGDYSLRCGQAIRMPRPIICLV